MDFKSNFKDLESTMNRLIPLLQEIDSSYKRLDLLEDEVKTLRDQIEKARELIGGCSQVRKFDFFSKARYARKIKEIKEVLDKYCRNDMQFIQTRNLLQIMESIKGLSDRVEGMSLGRNNFTGLCSAPELEMFTVGLDRPLTELKKILFVKGTSAIVVSAPPGCGKTTLVTKLCHDEEVKGNFKGIFFVVVSKSPNFRLIVQNLLQYNSIAPTFRNDLEAVFQLQQLLKQIGQNNPVLLVLDDVWPGAEIMLQKFMVQLPNYKILVTSRSELQGFSFTYRLETLKDEDARALLIEQAGQPVGISPTDYEDLLQKRIKRFVHRQ